MRVRSACSGPPWARPATPRAAPAPAPWPVPAPAAGRATGRALGGPGTDPVPSCAALPARRAAAAARARRNQDGRSRIAEAMRRLSATVMLSKMLAFWNLRPSPARTQNAGPSRRMVRPHSSTSPAERSAPSATAHQRGLARAVRADQSQQLAAAGLQVDAFQHLQAAEALGHAAQAQPAAPSGAGGLTVSAGAAAARASAPAAAAAARAAAAG